MDLTLSAFIRYGSGPWYYAIEFLNNNNHAQCTTQELSELFHKIVLAILVFLHVT